MEGNTVISSKLILAKYRRKEVLLEVDGIAFKKHRQILESQLATYTRVIDPKSPFGMLLLREAHDRFHSVDFRRYKAFFAMKSPAYTLPGSHNILRILEQKCLMSSS